MTPDYKLEKETSLIEAILYLEGEPISEETLCKISGLSQEILTDTLAKLQENYTENSRGIEITKMMGGWVITPKKELWDHLKERYGKRNEARLSKSAMETLSIIAYSQPVTRAEIEAIRGVSADGMIKLLMEKDLIKEIGKKDIPGKPAMFGTTKEFLKIFRLNSISDLPKMEETESERFELAR